MGHPCKAKMTFGFGCVPHTCAAKRIHAGGTFRHVCGFTCGAKLHDISGVGIHTKLDLGVHCWCQAETFHIFFWGGGTRILSGPSTNKMFCTSAMAVAILLCCH